ncbi:hypothetical protein [Roseovarius sp. D22-M7]|uniref:hypothetical protein n=1 Tax=Roseovarius sp. D22-M7 TaxID=3127116 RepID=UPI00301053B5
MRPHAWLGAGCLLALSLDAAAQDAGPQSRTPLGEAIRETLIATPEVLTGLTGAASAPIDLYAEDTARDLDLLDRTAPRLFDPKHPGIGPEGAPIRIAIFTRDGCPDCADAIADLRGLADRLGFRATVLDIAEHADLARDLGLDMAPSYVMRDRMLRGAMPKVVLKRYLSE